MLATLSTQVCIFMDFCDALDSLPVSQPVNVTLRSFSCVYTWWMTKCVKIPMLSQMHNYCQIQIGTYKASTFHHTGTSILMWMKARRGKEGFLQTLFFGAPFSTSDLNCFLTCVYDLKKTQLWFFLYLHYYYYKKRFGKRVFFFSTFLEFVFVILISATRGSVASVPLHYVFNGSKSIHVFLQGSFN